VCVCVCVCVGPIDFGSGSYLISPTRTETPTRPSQLVRP